MKKLDFLKKLKSEGKLKLVDPSNDVCRSYTVKAEDCLKSAKLLLSEGLYENSISMSYYTMYDVLTALLLKIGVKCENHTGAVLLLEKIFNRSDLYELIRKAKKERIDKQYFIMDDDSFVIERSASELLYIAEQFLVEIKLLIENVKTDEIEDLRKSSLE